MRLPRLNLTWLRRKKAKAKAATKKATKKVASKKKAGGTK